MRGGTNLLEDSETFCLGKIAQKSEKSSSNYHNRPKTIFTCPIKEKRSPNGLKLANLATLTSNVPVETA